MNKLNLEKQLIKKITRRLSKTKQTKYDKLTQKRIDEIITIEELAELRNLIELVEKIEMEKAQAIFLLSKIKKISPNQLMNNFQ